MDKIRKIAKAIDEYGAKTRTPDYEGLVSHVVRKAQVSRADVEDVIQFLQECHATSDRQLPVPLESIVPDMSKPLDIGAEIHYNYAVAKALLERTLNTTMPDSEEVRKTLREISRFLETMLKMQERVYNVQQIVRFQEAVLDTIDALDPTLKSRIVEALLECAP